MMFNLFKKEKKTLYPDIIQFSPIRSGSTLVYNILREIFPMNNIIKAHQIQDKLLVTNKVVTTFRNPLDCLCSSFMRYGIIPNQENIHSQIDELKRNGLDDLYENFDDARLIKLRYESFFKHYDYIFEILEFRFEISITTDMRKKLMEKYSLDNVIKISSRYEKFGKYDQLTKFHGKHISKYKGQIKVYKDFFADQQLEVIYNQLEKYIIKFGYSYE